LWAVLDVDDDGYGAVGVREGEALGKDATFVIKARLDVDRSAVHGRKPFGCCARAFAFALCDADFAEQSDHCDGAAQWV